MKTRFFLRVAAGMLICAGVQAPAQQYTATTIHIKGAPEYSEAELLRVAELKAGLAMTQSDLQDHGQKLMDTGLFDNVTFQFNGGTLTYELTPAAGLLPVRLQNFPPAIDRVAETTLQEQIPIYRGKVPAEGGLLAQVSGALEAMLATEGIKGTVEAMATPAAVGQKPAMGFSIVSPAVEVGVIKPDSAEAAPDANTMGILAKLEGSPYDAIGTRNQIVTYVGNYYHDHGYLEAAIDATPSGTATVTERAIQIPFAVKIVRGQQYRLTRVQLAPDGVVAQPEFDRQSQVHPGEVAEGQHLTDDWVFISRQYHNRGYMTAAVHPLPTFDRTAGTVSFAVSVDPGPVYTMGKLILENGADDLRAAMLAAWKLPEGSVFNESTVEAYFRSQGKTRLGATFDSSICKFSPIVHDDTHTVDVSLRVEPKP